MSKDSDLAKWAIDPHTRAKHQILDRYLGAWFPKMASWNRRIVFLDGFAGRGVYQDGSPGSPIIALRRLAEHRGLKWMSDCEVVFYFIEKNRDNAASLEDAIAAYVAESGTPLPENVQFGVANCSFEDAARELVRSISASGKRLAPTFAFIDPFGYTGLPMRLIADLLADSKSEVFINFMVGHVQRFVERDGQESAMASLFGMPASEIMSGWDGTPGSARIHHLRDLYMKQLREVAGFEYVHAFEMRNFSGNVTYYLIHGTRHIDGVRTMKDALWMVDPGSGSVFADRLASAQVLFTPEADIEPLKAALVTQFAGGGPQLAETIEEFVILHTPYRTTHFTAAMKELESEKSITVERTGRSGYKRDGSTRITFLA